jgi:hypothetical protein
MIPLAVQFLFAVLRLVNAMNQPAEALSYVLGQVAGSAMIFALFAVAFQKLGRKPQPPAQWQAGLSRAASPLDLEFDFFAVGAAFVLDVELGFGGDVDAFAGNLDFEFVSAFERVGQAAEFFDELRRG